MIVVFDYLIKAFLKVIKYLFSYLLFSANISFAQWFTESSEPQFLGNVVSNLVSKNENSGPKSVQWNATNNQGKPVSAGVYIYSIEARGLIDTKKMILLR